MGIEDCEAILENNLMVSLVGNYIPPCGSLNAIGLHNLIGSGTVRRRGFVGMGMALWEEVHHCRGKL